MAYCASRNAPASLSSASLSSYRHRVAFAPALTTFFTKPFLRLCLSTALSSALSNASARAAWLSSLPLLRATASSSAASRFSSSALCARASERSPDASPPSSLPPGERLRLLSDLLAEDRLGGGLSLRLRERPRRSLPRGGDRERLRE